MLCTSPCQFVINHLCHLNNEEVTTELEWHWRHSKDDCTIVVTQEQDNVIIFRKKGEQKVDYKAGVRHLKADD